MSATISDNARFLNKLLAIEALHAGATTKRVEPEMPYKFSLPDPWERKLFSRSESIS